MKGNRVVYNICGNKHRLIVRIHYASKTMFIRFIGSHSGYDSHDAEGIEVDNFLTEHDAKQRIK
ncbi:MAG: type II toxin-antitoxin system HigB family toxin [Treponema sp.]|nr:type II toxin-antitoxin system HigB family toxin [Treponema sp.]